MRYRSHQALSQPAAQGSERGTALLFDPDPRVLPDAIPSVDPLHPEARTA